jgi:hypothetical protein
MSQTLRSLIVLVVGGGAVYLAAGLIVHSPAFAIPKDFLEYWASARLNLRGEDPYDPARLLAEQQTADPDRTAAVMMWNPPPALAVYMPIAPLRARWAALIWIALQLLAVMLACDMLWRAYAPQRPRWLAQVVGLSFVGTWWVVAYGQNAGLLLLGLAGFLHSTRKERPIAAGAWAALTALKPHLLAGFGVLLIADAFVRRGRISLLAGTATIAAALGIALAVNPHVVQQFITAARNPGPGAIPLSGWALPVPSYWLRMAIAPDQFWVQFVPCLIGCVALLVWRVRAGKDWGWTRALPVVVAVTVVTTPYGGWIFDLPVLLVPVIAGAARLGRSPALVAVFVLGQIAITAVSFATPGGLHQYGWVAPAVVALCFLGVRRMAVEMRHPRGTTCRTQLPVTRL